MPSEKVYGQLAGILSDTSPPSSHPLGYVTGVNRDAWAKFREELVSSEMNKKSIQCIDSALCMVCLDDHEPVTAVELSHTMLHNYGANR